MKTEGGKEREKKDGVTEGERGENHLSSASPHKSKRERERSGRNIEGEVGGLGGGLGSPVTRYNG